jgi:hypothetical protein
MPGPSQDASASLTGLWHGQYSYPADQSLSPVPFEATLIEAEAWLGGSVTERVMHGRLKGQVLYATVSGHRQGHAVNFAKTYEENTGNYKTVAYGGVLSADGLEISGEWRVGGWSGPFLMIRSGGVAQTIAKRVAEKV